MRWKTNAALAVVLLLLGAAYYVYEVRWAPDREKAETRKGRVFQAEAADVTAVELKRRDDTVRLTRVGEAWEMKTPVAARGDRARVDETLTTVLTAKADREIDAKPAALADFGLDKPAAEITLTLKDGKTIGVALGSKTPTGVWVYGRETGKLAVVALPESVLREATKPAAEFRDRAVLAFDRGQVSGFDVVAEGVTVTVDHVGDAWRIVKPATLPADTETVGEMFEKLTAAKVKEFVAEAPRSRVPYGLDQPLRLTIHTGKDKDRASRTLLVGRADAAKKGVYAMREGESSVLLLPEDITRAIPRTVAALRDKQVVAVDREKVTRVEVESAKGTVALAREKDKWAITAPQALPADQVEASALVTRVRDLRAQGFLSDDASAVSRVLAKPTVKLTLTEQGKPPTIVLLAPSGERRGGASSAYAAVAGRGPVVLVDGKALDELSRSVDDLRDHALFAGLEPKDIKRLRVRAGGQTAVLERSGDTEWKLVEPTRGAAKSARVDDIVYGLRSLRWKQIVAPGGEEAARYGLDAPTLEVVLLKGDGGELARLVVGRRDADRAYVRTGSGPAVYAVDPRLLAPAPKVPDDLKG
ncbi:MAG TPA: DUF4340 domain-containing protein [Methylomirabilota bacterium]|jgi:hypothetical protein|nr:DUF4340 domain-containing protein [Methylomirabilota bacterium]